MTIKFLKIEPGHVTSLGTRNEQTGEVVGHQAVHVFDEQVISGVNAAIAARRPLLVRGEPGIGKTQLARAAAKELGRAFIYHVVDVRSEPRDLLWYFDAVKRLADAQLVGALSKKRDKIGLTLAVENYVQPRALWWAFDWNQAQAQANLSSCATPLQEDAGRHENGCVVLIDEIDKGEADVPNGLLEALGTSGFSPEGQIAPVRCRGVAPLIVITTNEERALPDAFVRRCFVLNLSLPTLPSEREALIRTFVERGQAHFPKLESTVRLRAAEIVVSDRQAALDARLRPLPGQAEYLDLLHAVQNLHHDPTTQIAALESVAVFAVRKTASPEQ